MKINKFSSILCSILALTFVLATIPFVSGCDGSEKYKELVTNYDAYVKANTDIFDSSGEINIKYSDKVTGYVNGTAKSLSASDKKRKFVRLTNDLSSNEAFYEPVLKASLLYVKAYIHDGENLKVSSGDAKNLTKKFETLKSKTTSFKTQRDILQAYEGSFDSSTDTELNNLATVLSSLHDFVVAANDFGYSFMEFYENGLTKLDSYDKNARYGTVNRFYLKNLSCTCNTYVKLYLPLLHESAPTKNPDNDSELYSGLGYTEFVNKMLSNYISDASKIANIDKKTESTMTESEKKQFEYYKYVYEYGLLYQKSCRCMISVNKEWLSAKQLDIECKFVTTDDKKVVTTKEDAVLGFVEDCHNDCLIMQDMLVEYGKKLN